MRRARLLLLTTASRSRARVCKTTACLVTPQRVRDDEARGLISVGGVWIVVDRATGAVDEWPRLDHLDHVQRMRRVRGTR